MSKIKIFLKRFKSLVNAKKRLDYTVWEIKQIFHKKVHKKQRKEDHTISFCITCKGRLWQLKKTLKKNLKDNLSYKKCNFILIDYNSKDGLEQWVKNNFGEFINNKRLVYYKNNTFNDFNMAHAKNVSHKLGDGEIIVNLDADNFTGKRFADYVNSEFMKTSKIILVSNSGNGSNGRICLLREHFLGINGYDETFKRNYCEETDLVNRIKRKYNLCEIRIPTKFLDHLINKVKNKENEEYQKDLNRRIEENKKIFEKHNQDKVTDKVNPNGYGKGIFIKNFSKKVILK